MMRTLPGLTPSDVVQSDDLIQLVSKQTDGALGQNWYLPVGMQITRDISHPGSRPRSITIPKRAPTIDTPRAVCVFHVTQLAFIFRTCAS